MRGLVALVVAMVVAVGCSGEEELRQVTFMAGFIPQANLPFVGAYVADAEGFFAEEGIDVEIQHSAGGGEHLQLLVADEVQVTTQDAAVLMQRRADPGLPLVSIGLIGQRGQQAFVALEESGITTIEDWAGHRIGFKGTPPPDLFALLDQAGLSESDVELINVGFDPRVLTEGQIDVYPVFKSNEPNTLRNLGFDLVMWDAADHGIPTLGLAYVATEKMVEEDPETLAAFMRAVVRGIEFAAENEEAALDAVMEHVGVDSDREHQRFILETELADATSEVTEEGGIGYQTIEQWQELADLLAAYDVLPEDFDASTAFTVDLLPEASG
ncbi:MAG TPA: ABC transporter substrate-binding protein [Acidimicrobiia bacterium]|nr:ABC transporter substrate-binding protein [Acidimicrobiia bacterium]